MKNKTNIIISILIMSFLLLSCSSTGIEGIDKPIQIDGVDFKITGVEKTYTFEVGSQVTKPRMPGDMLLIVDAEVSANSEEINTKNWEYIIVDENNRNDTPGMTSFSTTTSGNKEEYSIKLIFGVNGESESFTLKLRDNEFILDSLISD